MSVPNMFVFPNKPIRIFDPSSFVSNLDLSQWVVQPKWDGHRALPMCDEKGEVTVYSRHGTPLSLAKNNWQWLSMLDLPRPWLLDGEMLPCGKRLIVWDYAILGGQYGMLKPYRERLNLLGGWPTRTKDGRSIEIIDTRPGKAYREIMLLAGLKSLEGFVLKRRDATNLWGPHSTCEVSSQFKYRFKS